MDWGGGMGSALVSFIKNPSDPRRDSTAFMNCVLSWSPWRETAEHLEHSNPQLYVGPAIRQKLAPLEKGPPQKHENAVIVQR